MVQYCIYSGKIKLKIVYVIDLKTLYKEPNAIKIKIQKTILCRNQGLKNATYSDYKT